MRFYGFHNKYGGRTTFNGKYEGELHVFTSRTERDEWVAEDTANRFAPKVDHDVVRQYKGKTNSAGITGRAAFVRESDGTVRFIPHPKNYDRYDEHALTADDMETLRDQLHAQRYA